MTTPGFISGDEYTDPGALINECFSESFGDTRARIAKEQGEEAELETPEEAEGTEEAE
jgi:hypothetical protein